MVRPKASETNLRVGLAFAEIAVIRGTSSTSNAVVFCRGPASVFAGFCACLPELSRDTEAKSPINRCGVTSVELNKALAATGLKVVRLRIRSDDSNCCPKANQVDFIVFIQIC
jgi:hypothetical protein